MIPPSSRMGPLTDAELAAELARSEQVAEYATPVDRDSARERLAARAAADEGERADAADSDAQAARTAARPASAARRAPREAPEAPGTFERLLNSRTTQSVLRTAVGAITRGLMGALVGSPPRRSSRRRS
jgi:hypothetical protein